MSRVWIAGTKRLTSQFWLTDRAAFPGEGPTTLDRRKALRFRTKKSALEEARLAAQRAHPSCAEEPVALELSPLENAAMLLEAALEVTATDRFNAAAIALSNAPVSARTLEKMERYLEEISNCRSGIYRILDSLKGSRK